MYAYGSGLSLSGSGLGFNPQGAGLGFQMPDSLLASGATTQSASSLSLGQLGLGMQAIGAITGAIGSFYSSKAAISSLRFQSEMASINADIARINAKGYELNAQSMLDQGQRQIGQLTMRAGQMKSAQRVALAANGVDVGVGSAAEIVASTDIMKEIDKNTIEANAVRAAWGYRQQAVGAQAQAASLNNEALMRNATAKGVSPTGSAFNSLLGSAGGVASSWYQMNKLGAFNSPSNG